MASLLLLLVNIFLDRGKKIILYILWTSSEKSIFYKEMQRITPKKPTTNGVCWSWWVKYVQLISAPFCRSNKCNYFSLPLVINLSISIYLWIFTWILKTATEGIWSLLVFLVIHYEGWSNLEIKYSWNILLKTNPWKLLGW